MIIFQLIKKDQFRIRSFDIAKKFYKLFFEVFRIGKKHMRTHLIYEMAF